MSVYLNEKTEVLLDIKWVCDINSYMIETILII